MDHIYFFLVCVYGLIIGSFSSALIYRVPRGIPWATFFSPKEDNDSRSKDLRRSSCIRCGNNLLPIDLLPLFSYLSLRGCCRHCGVSISVIYPFSELVCLFLVLLAYLTLNFGITFYLIALSIPFLNALIFIDLEHKILPNSLVFIVAVLGFVFLILNYFMSPDMGYYNFLLDHLLGLVIYPLLLLLTSLVMQKIMNKDVLGMGDIKFLAVSGLWLGLSTLPLFCFLAGLFGILFGVSWRYYKGEKDFPFGPALIITFYILFLLQNTYVDGFREIAFPML